MSLTEPEDRNPFETVAGLCLLRRKAGYSEEQIAKKLKFTSAEDMHKQLRDWELPDWIVGEELKAASTENTTRRKNTSRSRARSFDPVKELPSAGNATKLIKDKLEALVEAAERLSHMKETLRGRYFLTTHVDTTPVYFSREDLPKEVWKTVCEQYDLDPAAKGFFDTNVHNRLPGGAALSPSETLTTLIGVYALAGGRMDLLLEALHPEPASVGPGTWEEIRTLVEGEKADDDKKDGLKILARQLATWVRGSEVRRGRRAGLTNVDHSLACRITQHRKDGLSDEQIYQQLKHFGLNRNDVAELGDHGFSWS